MARALDLRVPSVVSQVMVALLGNHLWQSAVFLVAIALLTLAFRTSRAEIRYRLWLVALLKFLVPLSPLFALAARLMPVPPAIVQTPLAFAIGTVAEPVSWSAATGAATVASSLQDLIGLLTTVLSVLWLAGLCVIVGIWWTRWRRVAQLVRAASQASDDRALAVLRRVEQATKAKRPVVLALSEATFEPGVFGIWHPVLVWPRRLSGSLTDAQIEAIVAHELCHVRRHDNFFAALHMAVQAVFWVHPLVWWLGARLVDERERACDEGVIALGTDPHVYAEGIVRICQLCLESPLPCVAGVTGSDLKARVAAIMRHRPADSLNAWRKSLLAVVSLATIAAPLVVGILQPPSLLAQQQSRPMAFSEGMSIKPNPIVRGPFATNWGSSLAQTGADSPHFEVASIKPNKSGSLQVNFAPQPGGRLTATNVSVMDLIGVAYGTPAPFPRNRVVSGPSWVSADRFDIVAKATGDPSREQMQLMIRSLLFSRFKLIVHSETRERPIYSLVMARSDGRLGPRLKHSDLDCSAPASPSAPLVPPCDLRNLPGKLTAAAIPLETLARMLVSWVDDHREIRDHTGLAGNFEVALDWMPVQAPPRLPDGVAAPPTDGTGPSLFTALQEQLGLRLEPGKDQSEVLVIDHLQQPTAD